MIELAEKEIKIGVIPILDATFHKKYRREWVYALSRKIGRELYLIWCICNDDRIIKKELEKRKKNALNKDNILNEGGQYCIMKDQFEELDDDEIRNVKIIKIFREKLPQPLNIITKFLNLKNRF